MMRHLQILLAVVAVIVAALFISAGAQNATGTGYEWHHMTVWSNSTYIHPVTGKGQLAAVLDQAESAGWQLQALTVRTEPVGPQPHVYDLVFRAPAGVVFPALPSPAPPVAPPPPTPPPGPTAGGVNCPLYPIAPFPGARCYPDGGWRP